MRQILKVFSASMVASVLTGVAALMVIRVLPAEEYATYTLALAAVGIATKLIASSFNRIYIVSGALGDQHSLGSFLGLQTAALVVFAAALAPFVSPAREIYWVVLAVSATTVLAEFARTFFQRDLSFTRYSVLTVGLAVGTLLATAGLIVVLGEGMRAWQVLAARAAILAATFLLVLAPRVRIREVLRIGDAWRLARGILRSEHRYLFTYLAVLGVFTQIDVLALDALAPSLQLATYGSAFRYYGLLLVALSSVQAVQLPVLQRARTRAGIESVTRQNRRLLYAVAPLIVAGAWAAGWIIPWVDAGKYPDAVVVFRILSVSAILSLALSPYGEVVLRFGRVRFMFLTALACTVLAVALHALITPRFGAVGAAGVTLTVMACLNGAMFLRARRLIRGFEVDEAEGASASNPPSLRVGGVHA